MTTASRCPCSRPYCLHHGLLNLFLLALPVASAAMMFLSTSSGFAPLLFLNSYGRVASSRLSFRPSSLSLPHDPVCGRRRQRPRRPLPPHLLLRAGGGNDRGADEGRASNEVVSATIATASSSKLPLLPFVEEEGSGNLDLPPDLPRRRDALVALSAIRGACLVAREIQPTKVTVQHEEEGEEARNKTASASEGEKNDERVVNGIRTVTKVDLSPVTVADFAVQALVLQRLHAAFPHDIFVAEESSSAPRDDPNLMKAILRVCKGHGIETEEELVRCIDLGQTYRHEDGVLLNNQQDDESVHQNSGKADADAEADAEAKADDLNSKKRARRRVWCLDPIDGTKGFLRGKRNGGQYCAALALVEDGEVTLGVLGCPNLPVTHAHPRDDGGYAWLEGEKEDGNEGSRGCVFVASKGGGCYQLPFLRSDEAEGSGGGPASYERIRASANDGSVRKVKDARFCLGVEKKFGDPLGQCNKVAEIIHGQDAIDSDGAIINAVRMDSQCKYGVLARGEAEVHLRLPKQSYVEWIWDLAAGSIVIEEAGGLVTDIHGRPLDFSRGAKLPKNVGGIVATNGGKFHRAVLDAYRTATGGVSVN